MRPALLLFLLFLAACTQSSEPPPCISPSYIDSTGECVSQPVFRRR
ncbi:hypothetical protein [Falsiroseomonas bella]|nr:hypothetical protein [Falsiroseomonas bella]